MEHSTSSYYSLSDDHSNHNSGRHHMSMEVEEEEEPLLARVCLPICSPLCKCRYAPRESRTKLLVILLAAAVLVGYGGYTIARLVSSYRNPIQKYSEVSVSSLKTPGIVVCGDISNSEQHVTDAACLLIRSTAAETSCQSSLSLEPFTFAAYLHGLNQCLVLQPGFELYGPRDIVVLLGTMARNYTTEGQGSGVLSHTLYFGLFSDDEDKMKADITIGLSAGQNVLSLVVAEHVALDGTVTREYQVSSAVGTPSLKGSSKQPDGDEYTAFGFSLYFNKMEITRTEDVVEFSVSDLISALGGFFSIVAALVVTTNGKGTYKPYGLIHKLCYRHVFTKQRHSTSSRTVNTLVRMRDQ